MARTLLTAATAALALAVAPADAAQLTLVENGLTAPITVAGHPTDPSKLYAVERAGVVKLLQGGAATTVLDITTQVNDGGEGGLLSVAFPDDFDTSGRIYAYFTETLAPTGFTLVAASYGPGTVPGTFEALSRHDVLKIPHPSFTNHNGGQIHFGPDGNLWLAPGDGGSGGDPSDNAQNPNRLLGKILRITPKAGGGYTIPQGNPFRLGGGAPEVWATGLRNPFRFSFDRANGDLYIGDVGQGNVEEIDRAPATALGCAASYGWDTFEGDEPFEAGPTPANYLPPLLVHYDDEEASTPYTDDFHSITGGLVVRDPALTGDLLGRYLYTDYLRAGDHLFSADPATGATRQEPDALKIDGVTGFGEDAMGRVYASSINTGTIYRIAPDGTTPDVDAGAPARFTPPGCEPPANDGGQQQQPTAPKPADPAPVPFTPAAAVPLLDRTGPVLSSRVPPRQSLRRRGVYLRAACDEACRVTARGRLTARGRRYTAGSVARSLRPGQRATLRVRVGPKALAAARRALAAGSRPRLTLTIRAIDAAGNVRPLTRTITLSG